MSRAAFFLALCAISVITQQVACQSPAPAVPKLFEYIARADPHYSWRDTGKRIHASGIYGIAGTWTGYVLNLTSQAWLNSSAFIPTIPEAPHPSIWTHQLVVVVPSTVNDTTAGNSKRTSALYITGNDNDDPPPTTENPTEDVLLPAALAQATGTVCATLFQVPNQPLVFSDDRARRRRSEDSLVGYSWRRFLDAIKQGEPDPDAEMIILLPMAKAAMAAMDAITEFTTQLYADGKGSIPSPVDRFLLAGASKRGWTTWLASAADAAGYAPGRAPGNAVPRVVAAAPIVMDMLNFTQGARHMYRAYGGWTFAFEPYWALNITADLAEGDKALVPLTRVIDPLHYAPWLRKVPTLVIDSTGDEFFMPDDDWYWWNSEGFPGTGPIKSENLYRLFASNAEHSFATGIYPLITGLDAFYTTTLAPERPRPTLDWVLDHGDGSILAWVPKGSATRVVLRSATSADNTRRDFRLVKGDTKFDPCVPPKEWPVKVFGNACLNLGVLWAGQDLAPLSANPYDRCTAAGGNAAGAAATWSCAADADCPGSTCDAATGCCASDGGFDVYRARVPFPPGGKWRAFLVEVFFPGPKQGLLPTSWISELMGKHFKLTTQIQIVPNTFPFEDCTTFEDCKGHLV